MGDQLGCAYFALHLKDGVTEKDKLRGERMMQTALADLRALCAQDNFRACWLVGRNYELGIIGPQDHTQAVSLYGKACDSGFTTGCVLLGAMYYEGIGGTKDLQKAASFFRKACDAGLDKGCAMLHQWIPCNL